MDERKSEDEEIYRLNKKGGRGQKEESETTVGPGDLDLSFSLFGCYSNL